MSYHNQTPSTDIYFQNNQTSKQKANIDNYNNKPKTSSTFSRSQWIGLATSIAPSSIADGYGINCLNVTPNYSYLESPLGYTVTGNHQQGDLGNSNDWKGLLCGEFIFELETAQDINLELSDSDFRQVDKGLFKILKNKETGNTVFYWLNNRGVWEKKQPYADYYLESGQVNNNPVQEYNFKGDNFTFVIWKNTLYLCSGKEEFRSSRGKLNGLMKWDGITWNSIDTGKAGSLKQLPDYIDKTIYNNDPNVTIYAGQYYQYNDDSRTYNPSLIQIYKDRLIIAGSSVNPLQAKLSEWNNPDNFVDNVLGFTNKPLTTADSARPSSFIIPNGSDKINSINIFNDVVYLGTNKSFYQYQLVQQNIGGNVQFQLDALQTNNTTNSGSIAQKAVISSQNRLYFISDYQTVPEFSAFQIENSTLGGKPYAVYNRYSSIIDDTMSKLDFSKACIGSYSDKLLIGCKTQNTDIENNITILATPFQSANNKIDWSYVILDYIQPIDFFQNNRGCFFVNSIDGELYKITNSQLGVEYRTIDNETGDQILQTSLPYSIWQTGWTGYDPKKVTATSIKQLQEMVISGYFANNTKMTITLIANSECGELEKSFTLTFVDEQEEVISNNLFDSNINYRYGAKYYIVKKNFAYGKDMIKYKKLSVKIVIENSRYFLLEQFYGVVTEVESGINDVEKVEWV